jgi:hypothetical protein
LFPILTVESSHIDFCDGPRLQASNIDAVAVRIRPWNIKGFDATGLTKQMFGNASVEAVSGKIVGSLNQAESGFRHDQMQKTRLAANRTVTFQCVDLGGCVDLESNPPAMASAAMFDHDFSPLNARCKVASAEP